MDKPIEQVRSAVLVLVGLLRRYDFHTQADGLEGALLLDNPSEQDQFFRYLNSGALWGSAGSVFDIEFPLSGRDRGQVVQDRRLFRKTLRRLAHSLCELGVGGEDLPELAAILGRWNFPDA